MTTDKPPQRRRYWLFTMPRTASNMLVRILNLEEQAVRPAHNGGYFFFSSMMTRLALYRKPLRDWTPEERAGVRLQERQGFEAMQDYLEAAEKEGQKIFMKEHVSFINAAPFESEYMYGPDDTDDAELKQVLPARGAASSSRSALNLTPLSDEFLKTWHPTFLIRHPAKMLPSLFRTALEDGVQLNGRGRSKREPYDVESTLKFVRTLHDFYLQSYGRDDSQWPIVLDADDIMMYPELVTKYAELVDLDPGKLQFSWEKVSQAKLDALVPAQKIMFRTFNSSTGVEKDKVAGNIDVTAEAEKWKSEFGPELGGKLERRVRDAMPDYEYLHARRLRLGESQGTDRPKDS
ncbi:hypothetical protein F5Y17DRAFT_409864 [Xylariaceae sp. FL0594]|nr:hypothetical protein F5Y17DRAFT_409864 [Xylariaceae sp. FL0594]